MQVASLICKLSFHYSYFKENKFASIFGPIKTKFHPCLQWLSLKKLLIYLLISYFFLLCNSMLTTFTRWTSFRTREIKKLLDFDWKWAYEKLQYLVFQVNIIWIYYNLRLKCLPHQQQEIIKLRTTAPNTKKSSQIKFQFVGLGFISPA